MTLLGRFIVLEGIDGSGTTTQASLLVDWLKAKGRAARLTREPSRGPIGLFLRQALEHRLMDERGRPTQVDWQSLALLFAADRMDHLQREVLPALAKGEIVISDRYDLSSLLYQSQTSDVGAASLPWLQSLNERARRPDLTLVFDVEPSVAEARRAARGGPEELFEKQELQRRLAQGYRLARELLPRDRVEVIEASGSIDEVQEQLRVLLELLLF